MTSRIQKFKQWEVIGDGGPVRVDVWIEYPDLAETEGDESVVCHALTLNGSQQAHIKASSPEMLEWKVKGHFEKRGMHDVRVRVL